MYHLYSYKMPSDILYLHLAVECSISVRMHDLSYYPAPDSIVFDRFLCLFIYLFIYFLFI